MVTALMMLKVEFPRLNEIAEKLVQIKEISEVYSVGGRYDLVAIIRVPDNDRLSVVVAEKITKINGIVNSETMIAFKVYSRHDLEEMFSIGLD